MRKLFLLLIFIGLVLISIAVFLFIRGRQSGVAVLQVTSVPKASVFFDGKEIGKTPFRDNVASGEHTVKISPEGVSLSFEQKLSFLLNILTVIDRTFDQSGSHGYTLSLSPLSDKNGAQITVISTPTGASVTLDSELKGITPLLVKDVTASDHELILKKDGYQDKIIRIRTAQGYKLIANIDLAVSLAPTPTPSPIEPSPTATPSAKVARLPDGQATQSAQRILVDVSQTPNKFLRIREGPSLSSKELGRIRENGEFPLLEEKSGWFKIRLPDGLEGWVSSQYAQKVSQ